MGKDCRRQRVVFVRPADVDILRTDANSDPRSPLAAPPASAGQHQPRFAGEVNHHSAVAGQQHAVQQVHPRLADEIGDKQVGRGIVDLVGRADLLADTGVHHCDPIGQGERFMLVVGHQHRGIAGLALQVLQLTPGLLALRCVKMRQRFVEQ